MTARRYIVVAVGLALFIGAIALAGLLARHTPALLALVGFGVLFVLVFTREEGRR